MVNRNSEAVKDDVLVAEHVARARLGGISRKTLWSMSKRGDLPVVHLGRRVMYRTSDLDRFIAGAK